MIDEDPDHGTPVSLFLQTKPLHSFSIYTQTQVDFLRILRAEIGQLRPKRDGQDVFCFDDFPRYYGLFWLWLLGAYEVVRTMHQASQCFAPELRPRIADVKKTLSQLRIPFAKQELAGEDTRTKATKFHGELSAHSIRRGLIFVVGSKEIDTEDLMDSVCELFSGIRSEHILRGKGR